MMATNKVVTMTTSKPEARTHWLRWLLLGPRFEDEDKRRTAQYLNIILIATPILLLGRMALVVADRDPIRFSDSDKILIALSAIMVAMLIPARLGFVRAASIVALACGYLGMVSIATSGSSP